MRDAEKPNKFHYLDRVFTKTCWKQWLEDILIWAQTGFLYKLESHEKAVFESVWTYSRIIDTYWDKIENAFNTSLFIFNSICALMSNDDDS